MSGVATIEGRTLMATLLATQNMEIGLFTNSSVSSSTLHADLTEPTGGGYARKSLSPANWNVSGDTVTYNTVQSFVASGGGMSGSVKGYFVCTSSAPKKLIEIVVDSNLGAGITLSTGANYDVTPAIKFI